MTEDSKPYRIYKDFGNETQVSVSGSQSKEPAVKVGVSVSAFMTTLTLLVGLVNPNFLTTPTFQYLTVGFIIVLPVATALLTRGFVWSPASVMQLARDVIEAAGTVKKPGEKNLPF